MSHPVPHLSLQGENFLRALLAIAEADMQSDREQLNWKVINANSWLTNHDSEESLRAELPGFSTRAKFLGDAFPLLEQMGFVTIPRRNKVQMTEAGRAWYRLFQSNAAGARQQFTEAIGKLWFAVYSDQTFAQLRNAIEADWNDDEDGNRPNDDELLAMYKILDAFGYMDVSDVEEGSEAADDRVDPEKADSIVRDANTPDSESNGLDASSEGGSSVNTTESMDNRDTSQDASQTANKEDDDPVLMPDNVVPFNRSIETNTPDHLSVKNNDKSSTFDQAGNTAEDTGFSSGGAASLDPFGGIDDDTDLSASSSADESASAMINPSGEEDSAKGEPEVSPTDETIPSVSTTQNSTRQGHHDEDNNDPGDSVDVSQFSSLQNQDDDVDNLLVREDNPLDSLRRSAGEQITARQSEESDTSETRTASQLESDFWDGRSVVMDTDMSSDKGDNVASSINERVSQAAESSDDDIDTDDLPVFTDFDRAQRERQKREEEAGRSHDDTTKDKYDLPNPLNRLQRAQQQGSSNRIPGGDDLPMPGERSGLYSGNHSGDDSLAESPLDDLRRAGRPSANQGASGDTRSSGGAEASQPEKIEQITRVRSEGRLLEVLLVNDRLVRVRDHRGSLFEVDAETLENWRDEHGGTFIEALLDLRSFMQRQTDSEDNAES